MRMLVPVIVAAVCAAPVVTGQARDGRDEHLIRNRDGSWTCRSCGRTGTQSRPVPHAPDCGSRRPGVAVPILSDEDRLLAHEWGAVVRDYTSLGARRLDVLWDAKLKLLLLQRGISRSDVLQRWSAECAMLRLDPSSHDDLIASIQSVDAGIAGVLDGAVESCRRELARVRSATAAAEQARDRRAEVETALVSTQRAIAGLPTRIAELRRDIAAGTASLPRLRSIAAATRAAASASQGEAFELLEPLAAESRIRQPAALRAMPPPPLPGYRGELLDHAGRGSPRFDPPLEAIAERDPRERVLDAMDWKPGTSTAVATVARAAWRSMQIMKHIELLRIARDLACEADRLEAEASTARSSAAVLQSQHEEARAALGRLADQHETLAQEERGISRERSTLLDGSYVDLMRSIIWKSIAEYARGIASRGARDVERVEAALESCLAQLVRAPAGESDALDLTAAAARVLAYGSPDEIAVTVRSQDRLLRKLMVRFTGAVAGAFPDGTRPESEADEFKLASIKASVEELLLASELVDER